MNIKNFIIPFLALVCISGLLLHDPIPQSQNYHHFADDRVFLGVPNFLNVITNLPFLFFALAGIWNVRKVSERKIKHILVTLFAAFILLTFGSGYYHWSQNNNTLVCDRLPMVIIFMSFFAFIIYDSINSKTGYVSFIILNITGVLTLVYWILSEEAGQGDLRWYGMVQFFPIIAIPLMLLLYKPIFSYWRQIILIFIFFGLAKICEQFDRQVYNFLKEVISGHSLKHLFMAAAEYQIVLLVDKRIKEGHHHLY